MMSKTLLRNCYLVLLLLAFPIAARAQYLFTGKVEYERKVNVHAQYEGSEWFERYKSTVAKFNVTYFDLFFDTARVIYKPGRKVESENTWGTGPANENIVYTNLPIKKVTALKAIYEANFLVEDSMRQLKWKERQEIRTIAGHKCHKAVAIICDSVYVVAFYAEDIPVAAGPEMFGSLPGLILELAVPRLHTTWNATKIEPITPTDADFKVTEKKAKKVNVQQLQDRLKDSFKDWGKNANRYMWWTML
jgi:GLPGLI family protein